MPRRPPHTLHLQVEPPFRRQVRARPLRAAALAALAHQHAPTPGALSLRLTGDEVLRQLNRDFLGHDYATDVLSFPAETTLAGVTYFGDLAISVPRAVAQAEAGGHPVEAELQLLVVHGVLHLLGHDHATRAQKARMWTAQAAILRGLGAVITAPAK